jgi:hypothetical protein
MSSPFEYDQTAGDLLVAIVFVLPGHVSQTPTDTAGNQYRLAIHQTDSAPNAGDLYIYYAWNCIAAKAWDNTVTVSVSSGTYQDLILEEWTNVQSTADPLDTTGGATAQTGAPSCSVSPTGPGVAIAASITHGIGTDAGSGWTLRVDTTDGELAIDEVVSSAGTITPNTLPADSDWTIAAAVFRGL